MGTTTLNAPATVRAGRITVETTGDQLVHDLDERELGEGPARAIALAVARGIRAIAVPGSAATLRRRRRAGIHSTTLFRATGRLADGIEARSQGDEWAVVPPPDRLVDLDQGALERMFTRLRDLVDALRDPLRDPLVQQAIEATLRQLIRVAR